MTETRLVVLKGGNLNGAKHLIITHRSVPHGEKFVMDFNGDKYRTTGEINDDGREIMVYDG